MIDLPPDHPLYGFKVMEIPPRRVSHRSLLGLLYQRKKQAENATNQAAGIIKKLRTMGFNEPLETFRDIGDALKNPWVRRADPDVKRTERV